MFNLLQNVTSRQKNQLEVAILRQVIKLLVLLHISLYVFGRLSLFHDISRKEKT